MNRSTSKSEEQMTGSTSNEINGLSLSELQYRYSSLLRSQELDSKSARTRIRDLEDLLTLKETFAADSERQLDLAHNEIENLTNEVMQMGSRIEGLESDQKDFPLSNMDLLFRYQNLKGLFENIREALSCAICYEFYSRGSAVSLMCGHSFCEACFKNWEAKHLENFKMSTIQGAYTGPDCPECRTTDVRRGRVRIWAMEETVRLVEKGAREMEDKMYIPGESIVDLDQSEDEEMHNEGEAMVV